MEGGTLEVAGWDQEGLEEVVEGKHCLVSVPTREDSQGAQGHQLSQWRFLNWLRQQKECLLPASGWLERLGASSSRVCVCVGAHSKYIKVKN